jgi:hypothetical protein
MGRRAAIGRRNVKVVTTLQDESCSFDDQGIPCFGTVPGAPCPLHPAYGEPRVGEFMGSLVVVVPEATKTAAITCARSSERTASRPHAQHKGL